MADLSARVPAPGGGASAALHGAQSAALIAMVARYTTGPKYSEFASEVEQVIGTADLLRETCMELADADASAFTLVTSAYSLPKGSEPEKEARRSAIGHALVAAAQPPAQMIGVALQLITLAERLLPYANRNVITDVAAATEAARAAAVTARLNVEVNAAGIKDADTVARLRERVVGVDEVCARAGEVDDEVRRLL